MITERLRAIQEREHLTDAEMGARLGIHEKSWARLKHGRSAPHDYGFLRGVIRAYPAEMGPVIVSEITGERHAEVMEALIDEWAASLKQAAVAAGEVKG